MTGRDLDDARGLSPALVAVALVGAVVGSLGAPLITPVATALHVSLAAAQWTLTVTLFSGAIAGPVLGRLGSGPDRRATILGTLALVALGGALTTAPLPFAFLLIGRGLQGLGVGAVALLMSVARDRLSPARSASTIATLSVASTVGIGVGYPVIGLLDQIAGLRVAYGLGFALSVVALVVAWRVIPAEAPGPRPRLTIAGAILLAIGILGILLVIAEPEVWTRVWLGTVVLATALVVLAIWATMELRTASPLVDLRLMAQPAVLRANLAMLIGGVGMYLLFSLLTRYLQTPPTAGYGFGLPGVLAGAALIPFSALGFVAGRLVPRVSRRIGDRWTYLSVGGAVAIAAVLLAAAPDVLIAVLASMTVLGFGVGGVSSVMPRLVLAGVPRAETASVLSINQIVRAIGFSIGSALAGLLLAAATRSGALVPDQVGYVVAALVVPPVMAVSIATIVARSSRSPGAPGVT
jgi:predicted MFS family arabinose efflux permease